MSTADETERSRERDRTRRYEKPSRFSDGSRERSRDRSNDRTAKKGAMNRRVYVSNIPYEYRWQDVKDLFRNNVGNVSYVELFVDESDKPRGCGIVEFVDPESVTKCLDVMHRYELKGRKLVVKEDFGNDRDKYGHIITGKRDKERERLNFRNNVRPGSDRNLPSLLDMSTSAAVNPADNYGNTYGLSPQFLKSLGIVGPLVNCIFVANLDYKVDEKKLSEVFRLAGKVVNIDLSRDKSGASKGFAVIEYDHPVESVQAISMFDNQQLFERKMSIRMDRVDKNDLPLRLPEGLKSVGIGLGPNGNPLRDVSRNLPSNSASNTSGSGILGPMPSQPPQNITALNNVVGSGSGLSDIGSHAAAFRASLAGVPGIPNSLLGNEIGVPNFTDDELSAPLLNRSLPHLTTLGATMAFANADLGCMGSMKNLSDLMNMSTVDVGRYYRKKELASSNVQNRDFMKEQPQDYRSTSIYNSTNNGSQSRNMQNTNTTSISDTIIVSNLPPTMTWQTLRDKFRGFGDIKYAEMKGKDIGIVRFSDEMRAKDAVDMMDRGRIDGRTIDVRFF